MSSELRRHSLRRVKDLSASAPKHRNVTLDADLLDEFHRLEDVLEERFGFRPTRSQALRWAMREAMRAGDGDGGRSVTVARAMDEPRVRSAEELESKVQRLRAALIRLRDCDWVITLPDRMDAVRDIARVALDGTRGADEVLE